jgi:hypothetical protein
MPFVTVWLVVVPVVLVVAVVIPPAVDPPVAAPPVAVEPVAIVLGVVTVMTVVVAFGTVTLAPTVGEPDVVEVACPAMGVVVGSVVVGMEGAGSLPASVGEGTTTAWPRAVAPDDAMPTTTTSARGARAVSLRRRRGTHGALPVELRGELEFMVGSLQPSVGQGVCPDLPAGRSPGWPRERQSLRFSR